jgi:hypothetical protein
LPPRQAADLDPNNNSDSLGHSQTLHVTYVFFFLQ